jgi:hypothetical protein
MKLWLIKKLEEMSLSAAGCIGLFIGTLIIIAMNPSKIAPVLLPFTAVAVVGTIASYIVDRRDKRKNINLGE